MASLNILSRAETVALAVFRYSCSFKQPYFGARVGVFTAWGIGVGLYNYVYERDPEYPRTFALVDAAAQAITGIAPIPIFMATMGYFAYQDSKN